MTKHLGKYEILRTLGQGAMGEVYLAHHPAIGREVAIKTILGAARGEEVEGRFRREAEAAGQLNHPNLVTIFDFDKDGEVLFLVMEYVKGDDLEDLIKGSVLSPSQVLEVLAQVCDGLSHAHRNGIIHRDIKPSNIRVIRDGKQLLAKVMDFGIARMEDSNLTATGIVMGTVSYMAPEYIRLGHATPQSDLFAVGVMLYECLTGRKPFAGDNTTTILFKIVSDAPAPLDLSLIHGISPSVRLILDQALAKDPAARFQTAADLAKALRACKDPSWTGTLEEATAMIARHQVEAAGEGTQRLPHAAPTVVDRLPGAPAKGRGGLYATAGLVLLAAVGGGAFFATRAKPPVPLAPTQTVVEAPSSTPAPAASGPTAPAPAAPEKVTVSPAKPITSGVKPEPPQSAAPKPEAAKAPEPVRQTAAPIATDPRQAAAQLKPLVQAAPANVELNAQYLAALYRSRNAWDFERALARATAAGVTPKAMLAIPAFRSVMIDERNLRKANPDGGLLPQEVMDKLVAGL